MSLSHRAQSAVPGGPGSSRAQPQTWRPMAFSNGDARHVRNPICEPLWAGRRALIHVNPDGVTIRDEHGAEIEGFDELREAVRRSSLAIDLVADGYLLPGTLRSNPTEMDAPGSDSMLTAGQLTRQLFLGGGGRNRRREARELDEARRVVLREAESVT